MQKILRYTLLSGVFLVPFISLIVAGNMFFPFITGKNFTFRILVEVLFGAWILLAYWDPSYRPKKSWILITLTLFVGIMAFADFFGENPLKSIWSNFERMEGLVGLVHLYAYFLIITAVLNTEKLWDRFWNISLGVSVIMGIYGLFQLAGVLNINQGGVRVDGTFGNAAYLAVYNLFNIFIAAFLMLKQKRILLTQSIYGGVILLNLIILYFTATRGAILGLLGGIFLTTILVALFEKERLVFKKGAIAILVGVILLIGGFFAIRNTTLVKESDVLSRMATISLQEGSTRFMVWDMAWQGFKERPILGWGQENFNFVFNKYYNPEMYAQEPWFDRAHDVFFDWLIAGGILGLLAYLSLFVTAIYLLWFKIGTWSVTSKSILTGLFAGYFFQNLFVFDNLLSYIMFFSTIGYIHSLSSKDDMSEKSSRIIEKITGKFYFNGTMDVIIAPLIIIVVIFSIYFFNYNAIAANDALLEALKPHSQENGITTNLKYFEKALAYNSFGTQETVEQLAKTTLSIFRVKNINETDRNAFINLTDSELKLQTEAVPNDARRSLFYASFLDRFGKYDKALTYYEKSLLLSPNKQAIYFGLVGVHLNKGNYGKALELAKTAFDFEPKYNEARIVYAVAAIYNGDDKFAQELLTPIWGDTLPTDDRLVAAYVFRKQYNKIVTIWKERVNSNPDNLQFKLSLAAAYLGNGERRKATKEIEEIIKANPKFKDQGQYYINEIRAGRNP